MDHAAHGETIASGGVASAPADDLPRLFGDDQVGLDLDDDTVFDVNAILDIDDPEDHDVLVPDARIASGMGTMVYGARPTIRGELTNFRITLAFLSGGGRHWACMRVADALRDGEEIRAIFRAAHVCSSPTPHAYYDAWGWSVDHDGRRMRGAQEQEQAGAEHERSDRD